MEDLLKEYLQKLSLVKESISKKYREKNELEKKVVELMMNEGIKKTPLNDGELAILKWVYDSKIDYERLKLLYGDIYVLGLSTTFSVNQALKSIDEKLLKKIIRDCSTIEPHYEIKYKKNNNSKKGKYKNYVK